MQPKNWRVYPALPPDIFADLGEHPLLLQVLYNRGLRSADEVNRFLQGSDAVVENPYRLADMTPAVTRILQALERREIICVYGDFDADGVTATALLVNALQAAGGQVGPYIPDRVDEGYGLNRDAVARIAEQAALMITVDCGIRSVAEVALAVELGLDVIVTDHHSVGRDLPPALAVINPRRTDCNSGSDRLAGVGVAYRVAQAVLRAAGQSRWSPLTPDDALLLERRLLDYVAIGTVADMMPLMGSNRSLVQRGLDQLNRTERPGLLALMDVADLRPGDVDATAISFRLGPRLNAAGRLSETGVAYRLLRTVDPTEAYATAQLLESYNKRRRTLTDAAVQTALARIAEEADSPYLHFVADEGFQPGIVGLVAGKLTGDSYRPSAVVEIGPEESRGSARSIPEVDISAALDSVSDLLIRYGGHSRAAGFTVATERLGELRVALAGAIAAQLADIDPDRLCPTLEIDAEIPYAALDWALVDQFARLEPTGQANPQPLLLCRDVRVREARAVGQRKHLKLVLDAGPQSRVLDGIAFGFGEMARRLGDGSRVDLVCALEVNVWQDRRRLQLNIQDLRPTERVGLGAK